MSEMLKSKRATRGQRMNELIGEAAEEEETFWNHDTWAEDAEDSSGDESFEEEELKPDIFDDDFNDTESSSDEDDSEEEDVRNKERQQKAKSGGAGKYKEPSGSIRPKSKPKANTIAVSLSDSKTPMKRSASTASIASEDRSVRNSTKKKTQEADTERAYQERLADAKKKEKPLKTAERETFTQKELLLDALKTEDENARGLDTQGRVDGDLAQRDKPTKILHNNSGYIRHVSKRGAYATITFSNVECVPEVLDLPEPEPVIRSRCVITGRPAMYRDPKTGHPYATVDAFKEIRARAERRAQQETLYFQSQGQMRGAVHCQHPHGVTGVLTSSETVTT